MATREDYVKQYLKGTQISFDNQKNTLRQTTDAANKIALDAKEASDTAINENYGTQIADTENAYESELKKNEVQRVLNERQIARRIAEMGLTDSGLNRTQSTAVQLSYANQKGNLIRQRQKAVDTLAAAMRSAQNENALNYNATVAQNESEYNSAVAQLNSERETAAQNYGLDAYNADVEAENANIKAQNEALEKQTTDYNNLYSAIKGNSDSNYAAKMIADYAYKYDLDENGSEYRILLDAAGIKEDEMNYYLSHGSIYSPGSSYESNVALGSPTGKVQWNYQTDGTMNYRFKLTNATWNWGGGIDNNDQITIYYPDGTLLAENVQIKQLPKDIQKSITKKTAGQKKGHEFTASVNLKGLNLTQ